MNEKIQSVLNSLPHTPGIYLMKDATGTIIYVGKAISLYNRVRSYFQESTELSPKNRSMVSKIEDIEFLGRAQRGRSTGSGEQLYQTVPPQIQCTLAR